MISHSPPETEKFAADFASTLKAGDTVALLGGLGAGKTCFVRGMCASLSIDPDSVTSPTFAIMNVYDGEIPLYHFDMYRIHSAADLETTGFYDFTDGIRVIEWSENISEFLPENTKFVKISVINETDRIIKLENSRH
ncbi:MAG: tRNA (adenosine(37)-N6)-threonylcarbamoyltransferase complex ATPase subunit type 1 TsaE [Ruminococcus sp.]|nr:tRNA (adenosine(37)-N6)-threonylcarbamoyltransferase complex ATPase subunit type 1 TsaE [Ruminococcus sp.]